MTSVTKNKKPSKMKELIVLRNRFGLVKLEKTVDLSNRQEVLALFSLLLVPVSATEYSIRNGFFVDATRCDWLEHPAYVQRCNSKYGGFY